MSARWIGLALLGCCLCEVTAHAQCATCGPDKYNSFDERPTITGNAFGDCDDCCGDCFWLRAEYLLWYLKKGPQEDPLVTMGTEASLGIFGDPDTTVIFGQRGLNFGVHSGGRLTAGAWLDPKQNIGIDARGFILEERPVIFNAGGLPVISRPFINAQTGQEDALIDAFPGLFIGGATVRAANQLWGGDANVLINMSRGNTWEWNLVAGGRYLNMDENLEVTDISITQVDIVTGFALAPAGSTITDTDRFRTANQFYGGQIGADAEFRWGVIYLDARGTVAFGQSHQVVEIAGSTTVIPPGGPPITVPGGLLAVASNSGRFERDRFAVVGEAELRLGWQVASNVRLFAGYNFIYWNKVVRPGNQIDPTVDPQQVPQFSGNFLTPQVRPAFTFAETDVWAQGLNLGLELRY